MINFTLKIKKDGKIMNKNTDKPQRERKVVVRDFTQQGERNKAKDELIKSGYKVVVKDFTKEESHGEFHLPEK